MTSEHSVTANPAPATTPEEFLEALMARVGVDGLLAAMGSPGLMAAVDQHAAAVRQSLAGSRLAISAVSVAAAASRMGRELPDPETMDWSKASWFQLRLMAVCSLAITHDCV
jgi:hypothetical protein